MAISRRGSAVEAGGESASRLPSNLFPLLFERLAANRRLTVLDVGPALPATVDFFSRLRCRLYFIDLYDEPLVRDDPEEASEDELVQQFQAALDLPAGTQIDVCLFWDFLNYVDGPAVRAFVHALQPYVYEDTRAHGFGMLNAKTVLVNQQYGIEQIDQLKLYPRRDPQPPVYSHSQRELNELLGYFQIDKSRLMSDGRLEFLLKCPGPGRQQEKNSVWNF